MRAKAGRRAQGERRKGGGESLVERLLGAGAQDSAQPTRNHATQQPHQQQPNNQTPTTNYSYVWHDPASAVGYTASQVHPTTGAPIGAQAQSKWLRVVPWGLHKLLRHIESRYGPGLEVIITENGCSAPGEAAMRVEDAVRDDFRVAFYADYIDAVCQAVQEGCNVTTYLAWSALDNFEVCCVLCCICAFVCLLCLCFDS